MDLKPYTGEVVPAKSQNMTPYDGDVIPAGGAAKKPQSSLIRRTLGDTAVDVGRGIIGVGEAAVGLANIPTFGYAGKGLEAIGYDPGRTKEMIGSLHSPERQAARAKVDQAEGFVGTAKAMLQNPSTIAGVVAESAPSMLGGGAVARGLTAIPKLSRLGATARGAIGEGAVGAGAAAEGIRQQTEDGTLSGRQVVAALGTGATTAGFAGAGGVLARRLGIGDVDTALAGRVPGMADEGMRPGLVRRTAQGAVTEGALEEMPQSMSEQAWQNFALDRPLGEGVGESAAEGLLAGAAMGGTFSAVSGSNSRPLAQPVAADKPSGEALDDAIRQQFAAQYRTDGTTRINSRVLGRAWGVPAKQVQAAARRVARDFDPASVADMVASDAPAQQEGGNLTDTLRQQQEAQMLADIEAAETPEDRAAAEAALAQFQQQVAAFDQGATDGNDLDASPAPVAPAGDGVAAGGEALPGSGAQLDGDGNGDAGGSVADVPTDLAGAGATGDAQSALTAAPLALPPPGPVTVDAQGNATTAAQADASAREREALGLTPDILRAQELRNARQAVTYPDAAPGSLADAANAVPTLLDGSPVPDPAGGPLSRAVNEGVASGAVPTTQQAPMAEPMPEPVAEQPGPSADTGLMPGVRMEPLGEKGLLVHGDVAAIRERLAEAGFRKKGRNQNGVLRFDAKDRDELEVALAQDAVPQPRRQWKDMTGPDGRPVLDSQGRPRKEPVLDYSTDTLVHWLAANGGVNFEQVRAQGGADPALMRDNSVQRPFGVIGTPALRRNGGMSLDEVRERMQQSGWLPADDPNSPPTVSDNDALDLIMDAINGREVYHPYEGAEARLMREAAERDAQPSHFGDALLDETTDENAIAAWEDDFAPFAETLGREPVEDDIGPAYTVAEIMKMALDLGADPFDVHQPSNRPQQQHARVLWDIIKELRDGTDLGRVSKTGRRSDTPASGGGAAFVPSPATRPGEAGSDAEPSGRGANDGGGSGGNSSVGDFQLAGQNAQPEQVAQPASQSGLFAPPTRGEMMDAEIARRDAARNGQDGTGRTDMMAGDGELFAGPRPEQADIEQQEAPNLSQAGAQVNESAGTLPTVPAESQQRAAESGQRGAESEPPVGQQPEQGPPRAAIEDFGEVLEGARKHLPPSLAEELGDDQIASQPLSKIWPANAHESIEDDTAAALGKNKERYPYLFPEEEAPVAAAFDNLFATIESRTDPETGNVGLFSFAGPRAATADTMALETAQQRIDAGENAEQVRQDTGWFRGADGKWRFEISDDNARLKVADSGYLPRDLQVRENEAGLWAAMPLGELLDHPALFAAYPDLADMTVTLLSYGDGGHYRAGEYGGIVLRGALSRRPVFTARRGPYAVSEAEAAALNAEEEALGDYRVSSDAGVLSTLLHEIQHGIQNIEGFATGGTPEQFRSNETQAKAMRDGATLKRMLETRGDIEGAVELFKRRIGREPAPFSQAYALANDRTADELLADARRAEELTPHEQYRRLAGEAEARNVQARQWMTADDRRATSPSATQDVADADVIVVFNGQEMQSAPAPANASVRSGPRFLTQATDVQAAVRQVLDTWQGDKPVVRVVQTVAEARARGAALPANAPTDFEGWWDGGSTVYIVAENNRDVARALEVLSHEAIGHYGIEKVLGGKEWARLVADVKRLRGMSRADMSPKIRQVMQSAERRYGQESDVVFAKEMLAIMAEQGVRSGLTARVAAAIRQFLAKLGIPLNIGRTFREAELLAALHRGRQQVTQAQRGQRASSEAPARALAFSKPDDAPKMPSGVGALSPEQLDVLRQLGLISQEQEADLSGQAQGSRDERPTNEWGERITTEQDRDAYLRLWGRANGELSDGSSPESSAPVGTGSRPVERVVRRLSESATRELGGVHDATRDFAVRLGPFSGYQTRARIKNQGMPQESLVVEVRGNEQVAAGLDEEPALTWTIHTASGEMDVNGPSPDRATFRAFQKRGWADHARGQDGEVAAGWTALRNPDGSASLPMGQILPMLADVHARYRALRKEDRVGLHWSRITGATGGPAGRETAVFFSRPDTTTQTPPSGGVSASVGQRLTGAVRKTLDVVDKKTGRGAVKRPDWVSQSVAGKFDTFSGKKPTKQWFDELRDRAGEKLTQRIFDQFRSMRNYSAEGFMQAHLSRATDGTLESVFNYGIPVLKDGAYYIDEKNGGLKGLLAGLGSVEEMQRFFMWIAGNRSERLAAEGRENLFTPEDITEMKAYSDGKLPDGRSRKSVYDQTLRQFNRFQRAILDIAERAGEIDPESRALWQSEFYLPYYRVAEETGQPFSPGNAGLVRQSVVKRLKGGTEKLGDPLENVLSNWSAMLSASMRNMAANKSLAEAVRVGAAERVPSGTKGATWTMVDGKQQHWLVHDPLLLESLEAMNFQGYNNPVMKWAGKFKRALSVGVTVNPSYRIRNLARDIVSALATADTGDVDAKNPLRSLASLGTSLARGWGLTTRDSDTNIQLMAGGGAVRFGLSNDGDQAANSKRLIAMGINENQILNTPDKVKNAIRRWWDKYQETGDRAETISRAVIYDRAIAAGKSHLEASFEARDLMNFTSLGSSAAIRALAQVLPFFNARLQGLDKLGRAAKNDPRRFWAVAGHVAMASVLLYALQGDDEEYQALPDYVRDTYWPVKLGGTWVYIPKPFELGSLGTVVERGFELMMAGDDYQAKDFRDSMVSILTNTLAMNPVPQIVKPAGEAWFNYDMFRNAPIDSMAQERLLPQDRYTARTSGAAVLAGRAAGVSPQKIEHMVKGYLGWIGIQALNVGDWLARDFAGMPSNPNRDLTSVNNWLVAGDFVKEAGSTPSKYLERFYESQKALDQIYATATQARRAGDTERALELLNDPALRTRPAFKAADRRITRINQSIRRVTADRSLSATEKNRRLENLRKQREEVARRVDRLARAAG